MAITEGDSVTIEYTGRLDDGTVFDTSRRSVAEEAGLADIHPGREFEPLTVDIGAGQVIDGLEEALTTMEAGEEETVTLPPENAYGERTEERVIEYDAEQFSEMLQDEEPSSGLRVRTQDGTVGEVLRSDDDSVRVDFNHELAGETLAFDVEVVDVR